MLTRVEHQRDRVAQRCHVALAAGVVPGMALADARALLHPGAWIAPIDDAAVLRSLRRLARRLLEYLPVVALDPPDGLWLDATGCERLYGGAAMLLPRLAGWLTRRGLHVRLAAAPTWGAAWAFAHFGDMAGIVVPEAGLRRALGPLPIASLRVDGDVVQRLYQVGIERVEQVFALPRATLADRNGRELLHRLDQALGQAIETIVPIPHPEPVLAQRDFDGPTDRLEDIQCCIRELLGEVACTLTERQAGCRQLALSLKRSDLAPLRLVVRTSRPSRDPRHLWTLLRPKTETAPLGFGVEAVALRATQIARIAHAQQSAWHEAPTDTGANVPGEVGRLVDTLAARLGPQRVQRLVVVESHVPEHALRFEPVEDLEAMSGEEPWLADADRPSLLFDEPQPAQAVLLVPDGPIASLSLGGRTTRILTSIGPERLEAEWWRSSGPPRDYFKVQTETGRWWWVYRQESRWFLHGEWA